MNYYIVHNMTDFSICYTLKCNSLFYFILVNNIHPIAGKYTVSFGVGERIKYESFSSWYKRLDEALYSAKECGRNSVVAAEIK